MADTTQAPAAQEPTKSTIFDGRDRTQWLLPDSALDLSDRTRKVFEEYSKIPSDEVIPHILKVRKEAWEIYPYPCLGGFCFLNLTVHDSTFYKTVTAPVIEGKKVYFDLGCGLGQDLRALVHDGAPRENLYAADLQAGFIKLGEELFRDEDNPAAKFSDFDVQTFDAAKAEELGIKNIADIVHMGAFLHVFTAEQQVIALKKVVELLLKNEVGVQMIGRQVGDTNPGDWIGSNGKARFHHNEETFKAFFDDVAKQTGTEWKVDTFMREWSDSNQLAKIFQTNPETKQLLLFKAERTN